MSHRMDGINMSLDEIIALQSTSNASHTKNYTSPLLRKETSDKGNNAGPFNPINWKAARNYGGRNRLNLQQKTNNSKAEDHRVQVNRHPACFSGNNPNEQMREHCGCEDVMVSTRCSMHRRPQRWQGVHKGLTTNFLRGRALRRLMTGDSHSNFVVTSTNSPLNERFKPRFPTGEIGNPMCKSTIPISTTGVPMSVRFKPASGTVVESEEED